MNNAKKGLHRDNAIVASVQRLDIASTDQILALHFAGMDAGYRKACQRLQRLVELGRLKRWRVDDYSRYCYFIDKRPDRWEHRLALGWAYVWLMRGCSPEEEMLAWTPEDVYESVRPDAFCAIRNRHTRATRLYFVELDRAGSKNEWDKGAAYSKMFAQAEYTGRWWIPYADKFPMVLCVTDSHARIQEIQGRLDTSNPHGLRFEVHHMQTVKGEARSHGYSGKTGGEGSRQGMRTVGGQAGRSEAGIHLEGGRAVAASGNDPDGGLRVVLSAGCNRVGDGRQDGPIVRISFGGHTAAPDHSGLR